MKKPVLDKTGNATRPDAGSKSLVPALVAVGGSLAALPAAALELGEVQVNSSLGQPLRASIAYALGPNEAISSSCVSLGAAASRGGLPSVTRGRISVANGVISVASRAVINEPLMSMRVNVSCPYTPQLSRDYMLFVDPAQPAIAVESSANQAAPEPVATRPDVAPAVVRRPVARTPIANAANYRVQPGDSLSQIAQRIENRPIGLWDAVGAIFEANPDAFINNDPNLLKAGSLLVIPDFGAGRTLTVADRNVFPTTQAPAATTGSVAASGPDTAATDRTPTSEWVTEPAVVEQPIEAEVIADSDLADLEPGDIILDSGNNTTAISDTSVVIPDTALDGPETTSSSPNVPTATVQPAQPESTTTNWFFWLIGAGLAIILALLFGRGMRGRYGSDPVASVATPQRRKTDSRSQRMLPTDETIEVQEIRTTETPALTIDDDSPTEENLTLDADLAIGTGLSEGTDVDLAQDFGFAATTDLDLELPEEMSSGSYEKAETDMLPPLHVDAESILESEVLPDAEDDDYDMSVIMDATKMPNPDDVTQRDLEAIEVPTADGTLINDDYTVSQEADYKILEQDYEDELTATQILNQEIARAAEKLASSMDDAESDEDTSEVTLASVTALEITAQLPANDDDDSSDLDETGINEAISTVNMEGDEKTAVLPGDEKTVEMDGNDKTVEMTGNDNTVEMPAKKASKR